jgi:hypothetical protein
MTPQYKLARQTQLAHTLPVSSFYAASMTPTSGEISYQSVVPNEAEDK